MDEIDARVEVLEDELTKIWNNGKSEDSRKGDVGESFVRHTIKQSFFDKGYRVEDKGNGTYRVLKQVNSNQQGRGGIDFDVEFTDENGKSSECLIEVKNLGDYSISKDNYDKKFKDRFEKLDPLNNKKRSLAIPKHQTKYKNIKEGSIKDNFTILPIDQQITANTIKNNVIKSSFKNFKKEFDEYIDDFVTDVNKVSEESIEEDLKQGKEIKVVAKKWGKSEGHIYNIHSSLDLPDRTKKPWKTINMVIYREV